VTQKLRAAAALVILAGLGFFAVAITPAYWRNFRFQQSLGELRGLERLPDDAVRAQVRSKAAQNGIAVRDDQIRVERSARGRKIEALYIDRVDLPFYTVDLHFRPGISVAGGSGVRESE
jgi:hypothetical protein